MARKECSYEFIETIRDILNERGVDVELLYDSKNDDYIWQNSHAHAVADLNDLLPFSRDLLNWQPDDIPPPLEKIR